MNFLFIGLITHRDIIISYLIFIIIFLGFHSFGLYIHNDIILAFGRPQDLFNDYGLQLKPVFILFVQTFIGLNFILFILYLKTVRFIQFLDTTDFMIYHIHAFTLHVVTLVLLKSILYSRSSRIILDKTLLGFRYSCDGPGRDGTCQISSWDAVFLASFWYYNSISIVVFHYFWKMQSDIWGSYFLITNILVHLSGGDFSFNAFSINGWLRNFLWSQAAMVIQSYSSSLGAYGFIFLLAHFIWAFSLMFLFSGRGYWQELIKSILWSHYKLWLVPFIQPRALSISQGRAVGLVHFILGGIGCTWSFFLSRSLNL